MSTNKTTNLNLHSWEATDAFSRVEFNENFAAIDAKAGELDDTILATTQQLNAALGNCVHMLYGVYYGDGQTVRTISIGVTPKVVMIWSEGSRQYDNNYIYGGMAVSGNPANGITIMDGGFSVMSSGNVQTNARLNFYYLILY